MKKPGLRSLLHPALATAFFQSLTARTSFVVPRATGAAALLKIPFLQSLDSLLGIWPHLVQAHLPKVADEASAIDVMPADARKLFDNGMGLLFDHAERISAELATWLEAIRVDLGFSALTQSRCLIYATPDGKGTAPHFDQNANFVLQLRGTKTWRLASNEHVTNPLTRHTMSLPADPELETYAELPLLTEMPVGAEKVELAPGALLFVPPGMWHSTQADGEALSLNFTYHAPAWLDLFASALRSRLALSPEWRATAHGVADPLRREAARDELTRLLAGLVDDLPHWLADDILDVTEG